MPVIFYFQIQPQLKQYLYELATAVRIATGLLLGCITSLRYPFLFPVVADAIVEDTKHRTIVCKLLVDL